VSYQWHFNGGDPHGGTNDPLALKNVPATSAGGYDCLVSNAFGSVTSFVSMLVVTRESLRFDTSAGDIVVVNGQVQLRLLGLTGSGPVVVSASSNLLDWEAILTNPPVVGSWEFTNSPANHSHPHFYRAVESSGP
jgi:hypothetical protein